jgi:hypothetical protein
MNMNMNMKKKGMQMAITTVMMIILSITVLTILIIFFNSQTGFLSKWFKTQTTQSNVDAVIGACDGLVMSDSIYAYCCEDKRVVFGERGKLDDEGKVIRKSVDLTCAEIAKADWAGGRVGKMECAANICV